MQPRWNARGHRISGRWAGTACGLLILALGFLSSAHAGTFAVFGPEDFVRKAGGSDDFVRNFPAVAGSAYTLHIDNGGSHQQFSRAKNAAIELNDKAILGANDFKKAPPTIDKSITLKAQNHLAIDLSGDRGTGFTLTILGQDTVAPTIAITAPNQPVITNNLRPPVAVSYADALSGVDTATLKIAIDGATLAGCTVGATTATCTPPALAAGNHTVTAQVKDRAGNLATATFHFQLVLDTTPPAIAITSPNQPVITSNPIPAVAVSYSDAGTGVDTTTLKIAIDGTALLAGCKVGPSTATCPPPTLTAGNHTVTAQIKDKAGNLGTASFSFQLVLNNDTTPPSLAITAPAAGSMLATAKPTLTATYSDAGSGIDPASVRLVLDGVDRTAQAQVTASGLTFTPSSALAEGSHVMTASVADHAGNLAQASRSFSTDSVLPTVTILRPGTSGASNQPSVPLVVSFGDTGSGIASGSLRVSVDGTDVTASCTLQQSTASCASPTLATGSHTILVQVLDAAGNTGSASQAFAFVLDQVPPTISATVSPAPNAAGWNHTPVTITYTCADSGSGVAACPIPVTVSTDGAGQHILQSVFDQAGNSTPVEVVLSIDQVPPVVTLVSPAAGSTTNAASIMVSGTVTDRFVVASADLNGSPVSLAGGSFTAAASLADGAGVLTVTARDLAGNTGSASVQVNRFAIPAVAVTSPVTQTLTSASAVNVEGTVSAGVTAVKVNGTAAVVSGATFSAANVPLLEGDNTLGVVATDTAGRMATASVQVIRDPRAPRVVIHSPADGAIVPSATVNVQGMVNDLIIGSLDPSEPEVRVNGLPAAVADRSFLATNVPLAAGANTLTVIATDLSGNSTTVTLNVIRQDPPPGQPRLQVVAGDLQSGPVGATLPNPLVVSLTDAVGSPLSNRQVVFRIAEGDSALAAGGAPARARVVVSDSQGQAQISWRLGTRAGAGKNRVEVTAPGVAGIVAFLATGLPTAPARMSLDAGTRQFGLAGQPLPHPVVAVVTDLGFNRLPGVPVTFRVAAGGGSLGGADSVTVTSDAYGRALANLTLGPQEGIENNVVEADFQGNSGLPARFVATGEVAGDPAATQISGVVLDNSNLPIAGVTLRVDESGQTTLTDAQGQFRLAGVPVGRVRLIVEGSTAARPGVWPSLEFEMITRPGRDNTVGMPIYLLPIDQSHGILVDETHGGLLTVPGLPGFSLNIAPGSATFPGGSRSGVVSVTLVHADKVPMVPNFGQQPRFIVTIQPPGTRFDPPAAMTMPNVDGLAPGQVTEMYSFDHDLGMFVSIGTASVSEDGSVLRSDPGVGVVQGGWHCGGNPATSGGAQTTTVQITSPKPQKLEKDKTVTLTAVGSPPGGTFEWTTDRSDVISFQGSTSGSSVVIKALKAKKVKVKVKYTCPSGTTAEDEVTIVGNTQDIVVIGWVDAGPPRAALQALAPSTSFLLKIDINTPVICSLLLGDWTIGLPTDLLGDNERRYANAYLLANSGNSRPAGSIDPASAQSAGDYRLFNRLQVALDDSGGLPPQVNYLQSATQTGRTPDPCGLTGTLLGSPETHPSSGSRGLTSSQTGVYQLSEGRLGSLGQRVNRTINSRSTPWIWSVIRFDLDGMLNPGDIDHQIFPTYFVYADGQLIGQYSQADAETFIALDETSQRSPGDVP
jgi:hypothetical protein